MIVSLLNGKLLPFPTNSTPSYLLPSQQSSASKTGEPLQRYSRRRVQLQSENPESREDGVTGIELLVKKLKHRSRPDEIRPSHSSARAKSSGKELEEQGHVNTCWLGKGFTSPLQVPQLIDRLLGPYSHSLAHRQIPKNILCYEGFLFNGVEYFLGDIVEVISLSFHPLVFSSLLFYVLRISVKTKDQSCLSGGCLWCVARQLLPITRERNEVNPYTN